MMIGMGLFWLAVILGLVWLARDGFDRRQQQPEETALAILDRRFAEGAVSLDEYTSAATSSPARRCRARDQTSSQRRR